VFYQVPSAAQALGTVTNAGNITGTTLAGVAFTDGGTVTNSAGGSMAGGQNAVLVEGALGTVINSGNMTGTTAEGVYLQAGGAVTNSGTGSITGHNNAVLVQAASGTVTNSGNMTGWIFQGVALTHGGAVTNGVGGSITGNGNAVLVQGGAGTVTNSGGMIGTTDNGVLLVAGGTVNSGGSITGPIAVRLNAAGAVTNSGNMTGTSFDGVYLPAGGTVTNNAGSIRGGQDGVLVRNAAGTVANYASMIGSSVVGAYLADGGTVTNTGVSAAISGASYGVRVLNASGSVNNTGTITGNIGIELSASGSVVNQGVVSASSSGIFLPTVGGGSIQNLAAGTISGNIGVFFQHASGTADTFTNAGTVVGTSDAFLSTGADKLIVDPGAAFGGNVSGGNGALELASGTIAGTLSGFGTSITNFSTLQFDPSAQWLVAGNEAGLTTFGIGGFAQGDTIDVTDFRASGYTYTKGTGLVLTNASSGTITLDFGGGTYSTGNFIVTDDHASGSFVAVACYLAGTNILTPSGEVPVETLAIGDLVVTHTGEARPIIWIGRRSYDGRFASGNRSVLPIRIAAGALADGVPRRDLHVSPKHALFLDGVLIPAENLVNGVGIHQLENIETIEYIHIELETHDIVVAEGAAAETFVDCDNRGMFHNSLEFEQLYPNANPPQWAYCAPLVESGQALETVRQKLEERLEAFGHTISIDPALRLLVDGDERWPDLVDGLTYRFRLTETPNELRILSRSSVPAEVTASTDIRQLGVNLRSLVLKSDHITCVVEHNHPILTDGYHEDEGTHRWTDGDASIPAAFFACFEQELTVEVTLCDRRLPYRVGAEEASLAGAADLHGASMIGMRFLERQGQPTLP
jgi:hypothetical protein